MYNNNIHMFPSTHLEDLVLDQQDIFLSREPGLIRDVDFDKYSAHSRIVVISGVRRCGKSTLLRQFADKYKKFHYINFDDERLINFGVEDFATLMVVFEKIHPGVKVIFIDEIQNVESWERYVRRVHDEGYKIFLTGSNAKLLDSELATHLTGRYDLLELYPFSFTEYLAFKEVACQKLTTSKKARICNIFDEYLRYGGFPEYLKSQDFEYLQRVYDDILFRDIIARHGIREVTSFRQLAQYIFTNFARDASYRSLTGVLGIKSSISIKNWIGFLQEAYLVFELFKFDYSLKKQYVSSKKIYAIDNGMRNAVSIAFSSDTGRLLENLVYLELRRRYREIFFFRDQHECDFIILQKSQPVLAVQVCHTLTPENRDREQKGLQEAMEMLDIKDGLLLTYDQDEPKAESGNITIKPVWRWLIE